MSFDPVSAFQFHEGPIKTAKGYGEAGADIVFQFHEGPIKTLTRCYFRASLMRFNSMKVRLKLVVQARQV